MEADLERVRSACQVDLQNEGIPAGVDGALLYPNHGKSHDRTHEQFLLITKSYPPNVQLTDDVIIQPVTPDGRYHYNVGPHLYEWVEEYSADQPTVCRG